MQAASKLRAVSAIPSVLERARGALGFAVSGRAVVNNNPVIAGIVKTNTRTREQDLPRCGRV